MSGISFESFSREDTEKFAGSLAQKITGGRVIALRGDLGAGKTCFAAGFSAGMGYNGEVSSPTFAIVNEYRGGRLDVFHFDMYRINGWEDLYTTGFFDYIDEGGVLLVEWSENIIAALPEDTITVTIEKTGENSRKITVEGEIQ